LALAGYASLAPHRLRGMNHPEDASVATVAQDENVDEDRELVEEDLLVEEISIDGMCGVY
jgi:mycofactocin precursor